MNRYESSDVNYGQHEYIWLQIIQSGRIYEFITNCKIKKVV